MGTEHEFQKAVVQWDIVNWWNAIQFWDDCLAPDLSGTQSLEIGCGNGGLSLWLARKGSQVICSDCTNPEPVAGKIHEAWGVSQQIKYATIDAKNIPYTDQFDIIVFKSVLGGIGWDGDVDAIKSALCEMYRALKPGGRLLFAENVDTPFHRFFRRRFVPWGKRWNYLTADSLSEMLSQFKSVEYKSCGVLGAFGRSPGQRELLGKLDRAFLNDIIGARNHYIMFGIATK